jgi:hypothetical protein
MARTVRDLPDIAEAIALLERTALRPLARHSRAGSAA